MKLCCRYHAKRDISALLVNPWVHDYSYFSSYVDFSMEVEDCLQHEDSPTKIGIVYFQREKIIHHVMKSLWHMIIHVVVNLASSVYYF